MELGLPGASVNHHYIKHILIWHKQELKIKAETKSIGRWSAQKNRKVTKLYKHYKKKYFAKNQEMFSRHAISHELSKN